MAVISANRYLSLAEMEINARYIFNYLKNYGFTSQAICGMLGNMQTESTINPGIYENLDSTSTTNGYGLVQWTPNTKYKNWVDENGFGSYGDIDNQLERIIYEFANGIQYIPTSEYPISAAEFITGNYSPEYLAQAFLKNYERPLDPNQPIRSTQARYWYDLLDGTPITPIDPSNSRKKKKGYKFVLFNRKRRIYG